MQYAMLEGLVGHPQAGLAGLGVDTAPRTSQGLIIIGNDYYWGTAEMIWGRAGAAIRSLGLCVVTPVFDAAIGGYRYDMIEVPNTANQGRMLAVAQTPLALGQYGWFHVSGLIPVNSNASVAADTPFGVGAAGQGGAVSAGKQVLNGRVVAPATTTVAKANCSAPSGVITLQTPNSEGWFIGAYLSGTGIAAGTTITAIDSTGRVVTLSAPTSAQVAGTVTATYNNGAVYYNLVHLNRPFLQGAIT